MVDWAQAQSPGAVEEILDQENKPMTDSLASKVTRLKSMTSLLTGSVKRFSTMARSGQDNWKLLCGMTMGLIVAFFILSYFLSRART
uniref:Uncharacterized protein n=1 Tax=Callithrix jacchus TaxID=9483 RepID=A0A2R8M965_CALJA